MKSAFWLCVRLGLAALFAPAGLYVAGKHAMMAGETAWIARTDSIIYFSAITLLFSILLTTKKHTRTVGIFLVLGIFSMCVFRLNINNSYDIYGKLHTATMIQVWLMCSLGVIHFIKPNKYLHPFLVLLPITALGHFLYFSVLRSVQVTFDYLAINKLYQAGKIAQDTYQAIADGLPAYYLSAIHTGIYGVLLVVVYYIANWSAFTWFDSKHDK